MAGDWIKWCKGLAARREVVLLASLLGRDRHEIAGRLMILWEWLDDNVADSDIDELSLDASLVVGDKPFAFLDALVGLPGFADALASDGVRWLTARSGGRLTFPNFGRHNGNTAKTRALESRKKQRQRAKKSKESRFERDVDRDISGTREEKRREEDTNYLPPTVPHGGRGGEPSAVPAEPRKPPKPRPRAPTITVDQVDVPECLRTPDGLQAIERAIQRQNYKSASTIEGALRLFAEDPHHAAADLREALDAADVNGWDGWFFPDKLQQRRAARASGTKRPPANAGRRFEDELNGF